MLRRGRILRVNPIFSYLCADSARLCPGPTATACWCRGSFHGTDGVVRAEQRLAASAASGVDAEVVSPFPPLLNYALPAGFGRDLARWVSEYIASLCSALPGRFYGLGTVPLQDPDLAAGELSSVAGLGLAGVEIASNVAGVSLADPRFLGHHRRRGGEVSVAAAGVQPRGGRVPAHADAGAVVLGPNLERGTARRTRARGFAVGGGSGRAGRAGPPVLV